MTISFSKPWGFIFGGGGSDGLTSKLNVFPSSNSRAVRILPLDFYLRVDATEVARDLVGKLLVRKSQEGRTVARIVETEAYGGVADRASHAYGGRFTERTSVMYADGGVAYVYLCYGMHHLFNVVTHGKGVPHAVLVRAAEPVKGRSLMSSRTGRHPEDPLQCSGPGRLSKAMGITTALSGTWLQSEALHLADDGFVITDSDILATPRIGVGYAGEDALLPYRFIVKGHRSLSGRRTDNAGSR